MSAPNPERLLALLQQFINASSWAESRRILEENPELLTPEADALLGRVLEQYQDDPRAKRMLTEHRGIFIDRPDQIIDLVFAVTVYSCVQDSGLGLSLYGADQSRLSS